MKRRVANRLSTLFHSGAVVLFVLAMVAYSSASFALVVMGVALEISGWLVWGARETEEKDKNEAPPNAQDEANSAKRETGD